MKKKVAKRKPRKPAKKKVAKRAKKKAARIAKKKAAKSTARGSSEPRPKLPTGFTLQDGILIPHAHLKPVPADKMTKGLEKSKGRIQKMIKSLSDTLTTEYEVENFQFSISFDAEGKVMGIGVGGSTSVTVTVKPKV